MCTAERLPGAVIGPRGSGRVLWKVLSLVVMMVQVVGAKVASGEMTKEEPLGPFAFTRAYYRLTPTFRKKLLGRVRCKI